MQLSNSAKILRQRAVAIALLLSAALAVSAVTVTALGTGSDTTSRSRHGASVVAQAMGQVLVFVTGLFSRWPAD